MIISTLSAFLALAVPQSQQVGLGYPTRQPGTITVGWNDEMDTRSSWSPLRVENKAFVATPTNGTLFLGLDQVPPNWPYQYQWSGVSQDAYVDLAKFPVLQARLLQVQGYAHLDIDVVDPDGHVSNTLRTTTLNNEGISTLDFRGSLKPGYYHFRLRLIIGGQNSGCCSTFDWVRFSAPRDADFFVRHPDWTQVMQYGRSLR